MHQYLIVGRRKPTEKAPESPVYRMKIFAANSVIARSRFWYYLAALKKVKKANGEIVEIHEVNTHASKREGKRRIKVRVH
jgi:large subunit ribosomal protein L18Ae